jgi:predicted AlkP superfamily phosphohydrolase/phosphomutase
MHHPDGILWMRVPGVSPRVNPQKVSLRDVAPTVLSLFGIEKPSYMTGNVLPVGAPAWRTSV